MSFNRTDYTAVDGGGMENPGWRALELRKNKVTVQRIKTKSPSVKNLMNWVGVDWEMNQRRKALPTESFELKKGSSQKVLKTMFSSKAQSCQSRLIQLVWRIHNTASLTQEHRRTRLSGERTKNTF